MIASDLRRELLGEGPVATVFSEWDPLLHRAVAVKELNETAAASDAYTYAFLAKARRLFDLDSGNVLAVYRALDERRRPALVRELADETFERAEGAPLLAVAEAVELLGQTLRGLRAMHEGGIVHGAVKPRNLFRCGARYKVGDFGVAPAAGEEILAGASRYAAPECLRGEAGDAASDLYSLGFALYELLLGGARVEALARAALGDWEPQGADALWRRFHASDVSLPALLEARPGCPVALSTTIQAMMRKERARRFATAAEALVWLGVEAMPPVALPPPLSMAPRPVDLRLRPPVAKRMDTRPIKRAVSIALGALVLVTIGIAILFVRGERLEGERAALPAAGAAPLAATGVPPAPPATVPGASTGAPAAAPPAPSPSNPSSPATDGPAVSAGPIAAPSPKPAATAPAVPPVPKAGSPGRGRKPSQPAAVPPPPAPYPASEGARAVSGAAKPVPEPPSPPRIPSGGDLIHAIYPAHYRLGTLHSGRRAYLDVDGVFADVPGDLENIPCIETAAEDGGSKESVTFTLSQAAKVYVGYDRRIDNVPEWLRSFDRRGGVLTLFVRGREGSSEVIDMQLFSLSYPAGLVTLGPNLAKRSFLGRMLKRPQPSMYVVCVDPR